MATPSEFAGRLRGLIIEAEQNGLEVSYEAEESSCSCCMPTEVDVYVFTKGNWDDRAFVVKLVY